MTLNKFPIGFWNNLHIREFKPEMLKDWEDAGFSIVMSPQYSLEKADIDKIKQILEWCGRTGTKIILNDPRTAIHHLKKDLSLNPEKATLPEDYQEKVRSAVEDFKDYPEVFAFHLIDEPTRDVFDAVVEAVRIVKKEAHGIIPFVNFYPFWYEVHEHIGYKDYEAYVDKFVTETGTGLLSYDHYAQMKERNYEDPGYFTNLKYYSKFSGKYGIDFWNTVLTTPHFFYRSPSYDDMRWQVNTSLAYGARGVLYYTLYTPANRGSFETNYRRGPINWWGDRTEVFQNIRETNLEVHTRWKDLFLKLKLDKVGHYPNAPKDGLDIFEGDGLLKDIKVIMGYDVHLLVSEFTHSETGDSYIFIVNANPRDSVQLAAGFPNVRKLWRLSAYGEVCPVENCIRCEDYLETRFFLAPGQGEIYFKQKA